MGSHEQVSGDRGKPRRDAALALVDDDRGKILARSEPSSKVRHLSVQSASIGAKAIGALAVGAVAFGALAIGALAIGRLAIGRTRIRRVEVDELVVRRLRIIEHMQGPEASEPEK